MKLRHRLITETGALRAWVDVALIVTGLALLAYFTIAYVARSERKICGVVILLDDRNQKVTPASQDQKDFIDRLHDYRTQIGC